MKNKSFMKILSALLAVVMVLCSAPLSGFVGLKFPEIKLPELNLFDFGVESKAASASMVTIASKSNLCEGEMVTVTVDLNSSLEVSGVDFILSYDSAKLEYLNSSVGVIGDAFVLSGINHVNSTIRGAFLNSDASINTTTGTLAIIRFKVIAKANTTTTLGLSATGTDSVSSVVPVNTQGTTLQIFKQSETGAFSTCEHNLIEFGYYPQGEVKDEALVSSLNSLELEWISYGYFSGTGDLSDGMMVSDDYMKYADVEHNGDKYRAVKFTEYRPRYTGEKNTVNYSSQNDNGYYVDTVYWFKFEPIKWRVLDLQNKLVVCETLIDAQPYNNIVYLNGNKYYQNVACSVYANDYANSSIREWLNNDFYNTAFISDEKEQISETRCDNRGYISSFDSETTFDKVFLLSYEDLGWSCSDGASVDLSKEQWLTTMCDILGYETEDAVQLCLDLRIVDASDINDIAGVADPTFLFDTLKNASTVLGVDYAKVVAESIKQDLLNDEGELPENTENTIDTFYAILSIVKILADGKEVTDKVAESIYSEKVIEFDSIDYSGSVDTTDPLVNISSRYDIHNEVVCNGTDYAKCQGLWTSYCDNSCWWLRSPGYSSFCACEVNYSSNNFDFRDVSYTQKLNLNRKCPEGWWHG
ncbi:MAG: hypothetical protein E7555_03200 [Ruminococcaceae bacterium]|nr:hypothetical protein [Oscillospiraceae bacterium]